MTVDVATPEHWYISAGGGGHGGSVVEGRKRLALGMIEAMVEEEEEESIDGGRVR